MTSATPNCHPFRMPRASTTFTRFAVPVPSTASSRTACTKARISRKETRSPASNAPTRSAPRLAWRRTLAHAWRCRPSRTGTEVARATEGGVSDVRRSVKASALHQRGRDALGRPSVPPLDLRRRPSYPSVAGRRKNRVSGRRDQPVGSLLHRDGAFRVGANGETRHAEEGGFLLDAARVGDHETGRFGQVQHGEIGQWLAHTHLAESRHQPRLCKARLAARVGRKHGGTLAADFRECIAQAGEHLWI